MKRLLSAALALSLLGGAAAYADPYGYGPRNGHHERWDGNRDGGRYHRHGNDAGTAIAVGVGLLALTAILASQDRDRQVERERAYYYRDDYRAPPPPPPYERYGNEYNDRD